MAAIDISLFNNTFALSASPMVVRLHTLYFSANSDGTDSLFRQVLLEVTTYYDGILTAENTRMHTFPIPVEVGATEVVCDIASAIRASLAMYQYPTDEVVPGKTVTYPKCLFKLKAWEREMIDGEVVERTDSAVSYPSADGNYLTAGFGGFSEYERWKNSDPIATVSFSTKPTGEIYGQGQIYCSSSLQSGKVQTAVSAVESGVVDSRPRTTFLFVNSRGVFETVSVLPRQALGYEIASSRKHLTQSPSYAAKPILTTHKQGGGAVWQFSSGYVNASWADWFASEFLMAKRYWMQHDGRWLPVAIEPDGDTVTVYDRNDPSLLAVNFTVRSAVSGSVR